MWLIIYMKKFKLAYRNYAEAKRIKCKNNLFKPFSDIVRLIKTTAHDQSNNKQWYFHVFKA